MFKELRKNHWSYLIEYLIKEIRQSYFLIFIAIMSWNDGGWMYIIIGIAVAFSIISSLANWISIRFCVEENSLVYNKGIIKKIKIQIPFDKITTIDIRVSIVDRICNTCSAKIDTGASKLKEAEIKLKIKKDEAENLKEIILKNKKSINKEEIKIDNEDIIKRIITGKELLVYAVTKGKLLGTLGAFFIAIQFSQEIEEFFNVSIVDSVDTYVNKNYILGQSITSLLLWGFMLLVIIYILITIIFMVYENIRLYKYTITSDGRNISINYGILNKKEYILPIKKIHALRYKQGILQQILGLFTIEAVTIGYGDENNEKAIIYPIANKKFIEEVINKLIPQFVFNEEVKVPPKRAISLFIIKTTLILLVILIPVAIFISKLSILIEIIIVVFILVVNIILGYINYRNTSLGIGKNTILATSGSLVKSSIIIRQSSVQSIIIKESPFKKRKRVCNFIINIYTNKFGENVEVLNMSTDLKEELYNNIVM